MSDKKQTARDGIWGKCSTCGAIPERHAKPGTNDDKRPTLQLSVFCANCGSEIKIEAEFDSIETRDAMLKKTIGEEQARFMIGYWRKYFA